MRIIWGFRRVVPPAPSGYSRQFKHAVWVFLHAANRLLRSPFSSGKNYPRRTFISATIPNPKLCAKKRANLSSI